MVLAMSMVGGAAVSAHRTDEYLQAARLAVDPGRVQIDLDLTPGIALAEAILEDIDRDRDGSLSEEEQRAYASLVLSALDLDVDGTHLPLLVDVSGFPEANAVRRGEGRIRLHAVAILPRLSAGVHQLLFRNRHHLDRSVYLANALVPETSRIEIMAQRRDGDQRELTIEYLLHDTPEPSTVLLLFGSAAAAAVLWALRLRAQ